MEKQTLCAGMHVTAKPIGARCNMACRYCFYSEKEAFYPQERQWRMDPETLERFIAGYIKAVPGPEVSFLWQGGEPMLLGLDFYRLALKLQRKYAGGKQIRNAIQTNGSLLDEDWCRFFRNAGFLVGLSLDGPEDIHDVWRRTRSGKPSHEQVMKGVELMQRMGVEYNVLCCVTSASVGQGARIYRWFRDQGIRYIQFAPVVECLPSEKEAEQGLHHAEPAPGPGVLAPFSVLAEDYGRFLCDVFDEWRQQDVGQVFVMNFEWALESWMGRPSSYCIFSEHCGKALALEHNGDVYACDHFVYPDYHLGNIFQQSYAQMLASPVSEAFQKKKQKLPPECPDCEFLFACHGECPKNRILPDGGNILCPGYRLYFSHIKDTMEQLTQLLKQGRPASEIGRKP